MNYFLLVRSRSIRFVFDLGDVPAFIAKEFWPVEQEDAAKNLIPQPKLRNSYDVTLLASPARPLTMSTSAPIRAPAMNPATYTPAQGLSNARLFCRAFCRPMQSIWNWISPSDRPRGQSVASQRTTARRPRLRVAADPPHPADAGLARRAAACLQRPRCPCRPALHPIRSAAAEPARAVLPSPPVVPYGHRQLCHTEGRPSSPSRQPPPPPPTAAQTAAQTP